MLTYIIIFSVSLVLIAGMIVARLLYEKLHKHDEHFFHWLVTHRARRANWSIQDKYEQMKRFVGYFNRKTFHLFVHLIIDWFEEYFQKAARFVKSKFPHHK